jgi:hypothetical protein
MPRTRRTSTSLKNVITQLAEERQAHVDAVAAIAAMLERWGIRLPARGRSGRPRRATTARPAGAKRMAKRGRPPRKKKPSTRAPSGATSDAVIRFVGKAGKKGVSSADLAAFLAKRGAGQNPFATIGRLVRTRRLKKRAAKGQRGSVYVAG